MKQLSGMDNLFLRLEHGNQYMHVAGLGIYDPSAAPGGFVRIKVILNFFESRLDTAPVFRRRLVTVPFDLDRPYWTRKSTSTSSSTSATWHCRLLDEPLSNLDAKIRIQVRVEIRKLQKDLGITTIYVTHDQEEALTLSDRIAVIDHGKMQQLGSPRALYAKPENPFVADFIGINNLIPGEVREVLDRERMKVQTEVGLIICTIERAFKPGDRCMVTIRPETASITQEEVREKDTNVLPGTVNFASYIGNTIRYDLEMQNGKIFQVDIQNPWYHQILAQGEKVYISILHQITLGIPIS